MNMAKEKNFLEIYEMMRVAPQEALKTINAGRLKGMSDINPQWRIHKMTEVFGPCGVGWKYVITKQWLESYGQEIKAFCNIDLFVKYNGEWSSAIPGTGGSSFVTMERNGAYISDECYKMALTDALSVAMKALGMAADVYFAKGAVLETKYEQASYVAGLNGARQPQQTVPVQQPTTPQRPVLVPDMEAIKAEIASCTTTKQLEAIWYKYPSVQKNAEFTGALTARKDQINKNGKS